MRSRTVEGALRAMGQAFSALGCEDPRLSVSGKLDFHLKRQLSAYLHADPPPHRVKPIPFPLIAESAGICHLANIAQTNAIADMLLLGFFFLLRPGEYACTENPRAAPFRLCDTHLLIQDRRIHPMTATETQFRQEKMVLGEN